MKKFVLIWGLSIMAGFSGGQAYAWNPTELQDWLWSRGDDIRFRIRSAMELTILADHPEIPKAAVNYAFSYLNANEDRIANQNYLTIIDFDQPSTEERMHVLDLATGTVSSNLVAHGQGSGMNYATVFSNRPQSKMSSLGIYLTGVDYIGSHGLSMRLRGMEASNSLAEQRAIVMHPADYVSYEMIRQNGRIGRSWGCPAVPPQVSEGLVRKLRDGSVFYIYHSKPRIQDADVGEINDEWGPEAYEDSPLNGLE